MPVSLIDQLQNLSDYLWRAESAALRTGQPKLEPIHLGFMRRAWRNGRVSYHRMQKDSGLPKATISRAGLYLIEEKLAKVTPDPSDKRRRHLRLTKAGYERFIEVENLIAKRVMTDIEASGLNSLRLYEFTKHLWSLNGFVPLSRVTNCETHKYAPFDPSQTVESIEREHRVQLVLWLPSAEYLDSGIES